jgi:hypothetical protein
MAIRVCETDDAKLFKSTVTAKCKLAAIATEIADYEKLLESHRQEKQVYEDKKATAIVALDQLQSEVSHWEDERDKKKAEAVEAIAKHDATLDHTQASLNEYFLSHELEQELAWKITKVEVDNKQASEVLSADVSNGEQELAKVQSDLHEAREKVESMATEYSRLVDHLSSAAKDVSTTRTEMEKANEKAVTVSNISPTFQSTALRLTELCSAVSKAIVAMTEAEGKENMSLSSKLQCALDAEEHVEESTKVASLVKEIESTAIKQEDEIDARLRDELYNFEVRLDQLRSPTSIMFPQLVTSRSDTIDRLESTVKALRDQLESTISNTQGDSLRSKRGNASRTTRVGKSSTRPARPAQPDSISRSASGGDGRTVNDWFSDEGISFGIFSSD